MKAKPSNGRLAALATVSDIWDGRAMKRSEVKGVCLSFFVVLQLSLSFHDTFVGVCALVFACFARLTPTCYLRSPLVPYPFK